MHFVYAFRMRNVRPEVVITSQQGDFLVVSTSDYRHVMEAKKSDPRKLILIGRQAVTFAGERWSSLTFVNNNTMQSTDCRAKVSHSGSDLLGVYDSQKARVILRIHFHKDRFERCVNSEICNQFLFFSTLLANRIGGSIICENP